MLRVGHPISHGHSRRISQLGTACSVLALALALNTAPARAQVQEVVIYGAHMPTTLMDHQASVAVVTEDTIVEQDIQNIRDVFRLMGNVIDSDWVDSGFVIRGVNSEGLTPGGSPLATVYIDGAPQTVQGARRGLRGLWDVSQVEVYRGPQSTLSGRAALAGAIYVKTNDPTFEWDAGARATYGENETAEGAVVVGGPLIENTLAFRIAAEYQRRESDLNYPGYEMWDAFDDFKTDEYYQVRGKLLLTPPGANGTRALLSYSFGHDSPMYDDIAGPGFGFEYSERRGDLNAATPVFQENRSADTHNVTLEVNHPLSDVLSFTGITSYALTDMARPSINAGTPGEIDVAIGHEKQQLATQEFRLNYDRDGLMWVAGLYAAYEQARTNRVTNSPFGRIDYSRPKNFSRNVAAFGEATYEFAPGWDVIGGGRFDYEAQTLNYYALRDFDDVNTPDRLTVGESKNDLFTFLPKAGIVHRFMNDQSLGFVVQRGYRSGGAGVDPVDGTAYTFKPEYTWNYELAYRATLLDNRVTVGANVFYTDWKDQQVEVQLIPGDFTSGVVLNAGKSHLYGGEVEAQFQASPELSGFVAIGYVKTNFDDFESTVGVFDGYPFPESPEWTISFGADYEHMSGFFVGADARRVSSYLARDIQNAPVDHVGDYFVANLRLGYRAEKWSLTLFSDNVFNEEYFLYKDLSGTFDCCGTLGNRRMTGVTLRVQN